MTANTEKGSTLILSVKNALVVVIDPQRRERSWLGPRRYPANSKEPSKYQIGQTN